MTKTKSVKLPKSVGGVKIPKDLRKKGERLIGGAIDTANSPRGREMLAMGLAAVATAAAAKAAKAQGGYANPPPPPEPPRSPHLPRPADTAPGRPGIDASVDQVIEAMSAAANAFLQRLRERKE